jgi:hypothetical protein
MMGNFRQYIKHKWKSFWRNLRDFTQVIIPTLPLFLLAFGLFIVAQRIPQNPIDPKTAEIWKDMFVIVASGIVALSGAYVGGMLQVVQERQREWRRMRRERTQPYREYLMMVLYLGQRIDTIKKIQESGSQAGSDDLLNRDEIESLVKKLPPVDDLNLIEDPDCRRKVNEAINTCLKYVKSKKRPTQTEVGDTIRKAFESIEIYENS